MEARTIVVDLAIRYGFQLLGALVVLAAGLILARWIGRFVDGRLQRQSMEPPMRLLIVRALKLVVLLFAFVVALDKFGFQIAPLVAGIGVAGLGIGFALQGVLSNVVAGLSIIFTKPFRVGEYIEIANVRGDVSSIELFSTTLVHADRSRLVIPNRKIVGEILHNFGTMRQLTLTVTVPHDVDVDHALAVTRDVVVANPRTLKDPAPLVGIAEVTPGGIRIAAQPWVRVTDAGVADPEIYRALIERFRTVGLSLSVPLHHVRMIDGIGSGAARAGV
jgi:small conductance mechanosensitive channel